MAQCHDLADLLQLAERVVPGLRGELRERAGAGVAPCASRHIKPSPPDGNRAALQAMTAHWSGNYPEAGRHYCALRCWGLLIWQPVYVSVVGVHLACCCPSLSDFCQTLEDGCASGYSLHAHAPFQGDLDARLRFAANQVERFCRTTFDELTRVIKLNPAAARGLQADCVLAALLAVRKHRTDWDAHTVGELGARWLSELNLSGHSAYFCYRQRDGTTQLALDRRTCCHHFRRRDGELCSTCPKLAMSERILRLHAEAETA
jgi:siderophore ferric iron reductase